MSQPCCFAWLRMMAGRWLGCCRQSTNTSSPSLSDWLRTRPSARLTDGSHAVWPGDADQWSLSSPLIAPCLAATCFLIAGVIEVGLRQYAVVGMKRRSSSAGSGSGSHVTSHWRRVPLLRPCREVGRKVAALAVRRPSADWQP
ncbi:hypothetical protein BDZ90DRAFT_13959 [Jaminaea rosea]|uniref:Uncharacterized protein n=1 Tax=Jaminaea rosea TaxID=1569628 RepID=A0A316UYP1_9BASI|nr:hypothetical protein BDZ90DRAFT_13959 [Jaminaea rosea]PWN30427.1 hypothetical protein BDZ90DRAFT_13959 [Jaminaea rosea]